MNSLQLIQKIEDYFGGKYTDGQRTTIMVYLQDFSAQYMVYLYKVLTDSYTAQFRTPPAIKEMRDSHSEVVQYLEYERTKAQQIEAQKESKLLLEGQVTGKTITVNGEQVHLGVYLLDTVCNCIKQGVNPKKDPEVLRIQKIIDSGSAWI